MDAVTSCRYGRVRCRPFLIPFAIFIFHFGLIACQKRLTVPRFPSRLLSLPPCLSLLLVHFFFGATVKGRLFTWQIARNSFHYHASIVASSLFDGLFPRPLIFYALCVYAPLHTMAEEKNGGPTGRPCRP